MDEQASSSKTQGSHEIPGTSNTIVDQRSKHSSNISSFNGSSETADIQNSEKKRKLYLIIYKFLQQQMTENQNLNATQSEALEVIVHCLAYAFQFFEFDQVEHSLPEIYDFFEKHAHIFKKNENVVESDKYKVSPDDVVIADRYKEKGNKLMREEKFTEALKCYEKAVRFNPSEPALYCNRAAAFNNLKKYKQALKDCNTAITLNSSYAKAYIRRGLAYEKLKDNKQALESYKKAFQLEPDNENYKTMYLDATKRLEPKEHESASSSSAPTAFNMFLGSNMASLPFGQGLDSLVASVFGVDRSWPNQPTEGPSNPEDSPYSYFS